MDTQPRIFISYSRKDGKDLADNIRQWLINELGEGAIWQDLVDIEGGRDWWSQITHALNNVEYMVLVATPEAMKSDVVEDEWLYAREQGVCVYSVLSPDESKHPDFSEMPKWMSDSHFYNFVYPEQKDALLRDLQGKCDAIRVRFTMGDKPENFVERPEEFEAIKAALLTAREGEAIGITTALRGAGGFGKTTLALALCYDPDIRNHFHDGILWVTLGEKPNDLKAKLSDLIYILTDNRETFADLDKYQIRFKEVLGKWDILIVIDDVWHKSHANAFIVKAPHCAYLITTRNENTLPDGTHDVQMDAMKEDESIQLLTAGLDTTLLEDTTPLKQLSERLGEWPVLLKLVNGTLKKRIKHKEDLTAALDYANRILKERGLVGFDVRDSQQREDAVERTLSVSFDYLEKDEYDRYVELAIFPEDTPIPLTTVEALWQGLNDLDTETLCERLYSLTLLLEFNLEQGIIRLHDVFREYLLRQLENPIELHRKLIESWRLVPAVWSPQEEAEGPPHKGRPVYTLPDPYAWNHIAYHLKAADQTDTLRALLQDFNWLQAKLDATDPNALLRDFRELTDDEGLRLIENAISVIAHWIDQDKTQFVSQITGRIVGYKEKQPAVAALLDNVKHFSKPTLASQLPTLPQAGGALVRTIPLENSGNAIALTKDEKYIVVAVGKTVKVIDWETGELLTDFQVHTSAVRAVTVSGELAFSASADRTVKVWQWATGEVLTDFKDHTDAVNDVTVSGELAFSAAGSGDPFSGTGGTVKVWRWATGQLLTDFKDHTREVNDVTVLGELAFSASDDQTVKVWRWATGQLLTDFKEHTSFVNAVAVSGELAFSASWDNTVKVWRWATGQLLTDFKEHTAGVNTVTVSGELAFSASWDNTVKVWQWATGQLLTDFKEHTAGVNTVTVSGELAFSASDDRAVKVWRWATGQLLTDFKEHTSFVNAVAVSGELAFSASDDRTVKVWRWATGELLTDFKDHFLPVRAVTVSGELAFSASDDRTVKVWRWATGELLTDFKDHFLPVRAVTVSGELAFSASGGWDYGEVKVWRWATGQLLPNFQAHPRPVNDVTVSSELAFSASGGWDYGEVKVWLWAMGQLLTDFKEHTSFVNAVAVSGELAFSASDDRTVKVWRWATGELLTNFQDHSDTVSAVTVSGQLAFSASSDQTVKVWRWATGDVLATFTADASLTSLAFEPQHRILLAGDEVGHVHVLRVVGLDHLLFPDGE